MPTERDMRVAYAYITRYTPRSDIEFKLSKQRFTSQELYEHLLYVTEDAKRNGIQLLEFIVYRDELEVWRGLV